MATLSPSQIGLLMAAVGWLPPMGYIEHQDGTLTYDSPVKAKAIAFFDQAIAVCLAESGGNTLSKNKNTNGSTDSGLWQINSVHSALIAQQAAWIQGELKLAKKPSVFHPLVNTACAHELFNGSSWHPWDSSRSNWSKHRGHGAKVYALLTTKKYRAHLSDLLTANLIDDAGFAEAATFVVPGAALVNNDLVTDPMGSLLDFIKKLGIPVGVFLLGLILLVLGVVYLISRSRAGKAVIGSTPAGLVKKAVT